MSEQGQDLGSMFSRSSTGRTRGALADKLPKVAHEAPEPAPLAPAEPPSEEASEESPAPQTPPSRKKQAKKATPKPKPGQRESPENYQLYVPARILPSFKERRDQKGTRNHLLVFDAIDAAIDRGAKDPYERLRGYVRASLVGGEEQTDSLFDREPTKVRDSIYTGNAAQLTLRITPSNQQVIEDIVEKTGAKDRGHLITVVLVHYLGLAEDLDEH